MTWRLAEVQDVDCTIDDSGIYVVINRIVEKTTHKEYAGEIVRVRVDLMSAADEPIISFIGRANHVRKNLFQFLVEHGHPIWSEHASYIGWELHRAEVTPDFVQD